MIRISQAGSCPRRLILEAKGIEGEPQWEGSERAFAEGHLHEADILKWARENLPGGPYRPVVAQLEVQPTSWLRGRIDEYDVDDVLFVRRHVLLEHELNKDQCSLLKWARWATNNVVGVVQSLRSKVQESRRAAGGAALRMLPKQRSY